MIDIVKWPVLNGIEYSLDMSVEDYIMFSELLDKIIFDVPIINESMENKK